MRLICPNCDAEYEVDDNVIPKDGRDVQCSSCGKTWFQKSAQQLQDADQPEIEAPALAPQEQEPAPEQHHDQEPELGPEAEVEADPEAEFELRKPDEAVLDVLRQEAAREAEARQDEAQGGLETQPDLGLDQADNTEAPQTTVSQRTARLRGIEPDADKPTHRSDLLPDIEEINSTLRAESDAETEDAQIEKKRGRSGFRLGFGLVIILATLLVMAYIFAPQIIETVPMSEGIMHSYVEMVNSLRMWLDQLMQAATDKMSDDTANS